jgi:hypothetical protein
MSRQIWLALVLAGACGKSAGNPPSDKDTGPTQVERVKTPADHGSAQNVGTPPSDDARFHLHPEEGTLTIDKADCKAGTEATSNLKVAPASGLHLATDYPIKITLEPATGMKLPKTELTAGGRDKAQGDAQTLSEQLIQFGIKATADKAGSYEIKGMFKFGVCDKDSCHPKKQPITIPVVCS